MKVNQLQQWRWWGSSQDQFPMKLYTMLELASGSERSSGTVAWLPHGRAFKILDEERFMDAVAPLFFRLTKIRSFHRQLHLWGFKRASAGIDAGAWHHKFFLRGSPGELRKMVRVKIKDKPGNPPDDKEEPNSYATPPLGGGRRVSKEMIPAVDGLLFNRNSVTHLGWLVLPESEMSRRVSSPNSASGRECALRRNNTSVPTSMASKANAGSEMPCIVTLQEFGHAGGNDRPSEGGANTAWDVARPSTNGSEGGANASWDVARPSTNNPSSRTIATASDASLRLLKMNLRNSLKLLESSPNSAPSPVLLNPFHKHGGILDGGRRAPSTAQFWRDASLANLSLGSSGVLDRKLGRRSASSTFPADEGLLAAGTKPLPFGASFGSAAAGMDPLLAGLSSALISSDEEAKRRLMARLEPLPFGQRPATSEAKKRLAAAGRKIELLPFGASSALIPSDDEEKRRLAEGLEPLPIGDEYPVDEFADYIDGAIQIL